MTDRAFGKRRHDITLQLHRHLHPRVAADPKLDHIYRTIELPVRQILFEMEREGVMLDTALLAAQSAELGARVMALEDEAYRLAGQPFNLASPKQLGEILFDRMKLPTLRKTATGQPSTDEEVLSELAADHNLTSYDAVYLELAKRRRLPLATLDAALVNALRAAKLPLITDPSVFREQ